MRGEHMQENHDSIDQAEILRKRMGENPKKETSPLPPRSEIHRKKDKKGKFRFRFPLIRILALAFIIIVCIVASYNLWKDHIQLTNASETGENEINNDSNIDVIELKDAEEVEEKVEQVENEPEVAQPAETIPTPVEKPVTEVQGEDSTPVQDKAVEQANTTQTEKVLHHKVKAGETLYRISMKYYKSRAGEEVIKKTNGLDANGTVMTGQILKIPMK